jgi:hypothetical protein
MIGENCIMRISIICTLQQYYWDDASDDMYCVTGMGEIKNAKDFNRENLKRRGHL